MELEVEAAGVADSVALGVAPPQRRRRRLAVTAREARASRRRLPVEAKVDKIIDGLGLVGIVGANDEEMFC